MNHHSDRANFIWNIADKLRGIYKQSEYGRVILPLVVLRRLDCVLEPTRAAVLAEARRTEGSPPELRDRQLQKAAGQTFYNTSHLVFRQLTREDAADPRWKGFASLTLADHQGANLASYISRFSANARQIMEYFRFEQHIERMEQADILFTVMSEFVQVDLHPDRVDNHAMGDIFEELIRKFSEQSNETAGEHFTPRDVIKFMVNVLLSEDDEALTTRGIIRTVYDPACGTGGMLSEAEARVAALNALPDQLFYNTSISTYIWIVTNRKSAARKGLVQLINGVHLFEKMRKSKGNKRKELGEVNVDELTRLYGDFAEGDHVRIFANEAFGYQRIAVEQPLRLDFQASPERIARLEGERSWQNLLSSRKKGAAAQAEIADGRKTRAQVLRALGTMDPGKVYLDRKAFRRDLGKALKTDGVSLSASVRGAVESALGERNEGMAAIIEMVEAFEDVDRLDEDDVEVPVARVVPAEEFRFRVVKVHRPLRRRVTIDSDGLTRSFQQQAMQDFQLKDDYPWNKLCEALKGNEGYESLDAGKFDDDLKEWAKAAGIKTPSTTIRKALLAALSERDPAGVPLRDSKGDLVADPDLDDEERIPWVTEDQAAEAIEAYMDAEVRPFVAPEDRHLVWADAPGLPGAEIPFNRIFYRYRAPRSLHTIGRELHETRRHVDHLLDGLERDLEEIVGPAQRGLFGRLD